MANYNGHGIWRFKCGCRCGTCTATGRAYYQRKPDAAPPGSASWCRPGRHTPGAPHACRSVKNLLWLLDQGDTVATLAGRYRVQPDSVRRAIRRALDALEAV